VVAVEHVGQAGDRPGRVALAAGGLVQRQRGLLGGRVAQEDAVAGDGPGEVVEHDGQPRAGQLPLGVQYLHVQQGVVGLPLLVRSGCGAPVDQLELVAVGRLSLMGQGAQPRVDPGDHGPDGGVARGGHVAVAGEVGDPAVHVGGGRRRPAQRERFDRLDEVFGQSASADVAPCLPLQRGGRPVGAVAGGPAPQRSGRQPGCRGQPGERDPVVQVLTDQRGLGLRRQLHHDRHRARTSGPRR
jgi:hypothetical protein